MNPLTTTSILLHLEIRKWAGEVSDKKALQAVADTFKSDTHNDKYKKSLFVTDPLSLIDRCAGRLRNHFYYSTVPWLDGGKGRLIPSMSFQDFAKEHAMLKHNFYQEVEQFITDYPDHKEKAEELKGELYNAAEYPSIDHLRGRFEINLTTLPFPNIDDFRITAPEEVMEELRTSMEESVSRVEGVVSKELKDRFHVRMQMLVKTLNVGKRFNGSLLTELGGVIDMGVNLKETISDELFTDMKQIKREVLKYDPEALRNSESAQEDVIKKCMDVLSR